MFELWWIKYPDLSVLTKGNLNKFIETLFSIDLQQIIMYYKNRLLHTQMCHECKLVEPAKPVGEHFVPCWYRTNRFISRGVSSPRSMVEFQIRLSCHITYYHQGILLISSTGCIISQCQKFHMLYRYSKYFTITKKSRNNSNESWKLNFKLLPSEF